MLCLCDWFKLGGMVRNVYVVVGRPFMLCVQLYFCAWRTQGFHTVSKLRNSWFRFLGRPGSGTKINNMSALLAFPGFSCLFTDLPHHSPWSPYFELPFRRVLCLCVAESESKNQQPRPISNVRHFTQRSPSQSTACGDRPVTYALVSIRFVDSQHGNIPLRCAVFAYMQWVETFVEVKSHAEVRESSRKRTRLTDPLCRPALQTMTPIILSPSYACVERTRFRSCVVSSPGI